MARDEYLPKNYVSVSPVFTSRLNKHREIRFHSVLINRMASQ